MEPSLSSPQEYAQLLEMLAADIQSRLAANPSAGELTHANWTVGHRILTFQQHHDWGGWVLNDLATDLQSRFGTRLGLSLRNLQYMRACAQSWPHPGADHRLPYLPWGHVTVLLDKLGGSPYLDWYAREAAERPWTRTTLTLKIREQVHLAVSLGAPQSRLSQERSPNSCAQPWQDCESLPPGTPHNTGKWPYS